MTRLITSITAAINRFWNPPRGDAGEFGAGRVGRYDWFWQLYWNTAYDDLESYFTNYPAGSTLYKYTRGLRNPIKRWVDFYVANVWGGPLDLDAGDGRSVPSALPIVTDDEKLRRAIGRLWTWSNWNSKRSLAVRYSATLGDCFIKVVDRPLLQKVYLQVLWPGDVAEATWDDFGNIKRAVIEHDAVDPETKRTYTYKEVIEHPATWGGRFTRFTTYRNGGEFGYPENSDLAQWETPYDFLPMTSIPWMDVGSDWGSVGFIATVRKIDAANALASQLADQVGKAVHTPLVMFGVQAGDVTVAQPDADGVPVMYVNRPPSEASIEPLISDLNLDHGLALLDAQIAEIQEDLPELRMAEAIRTGMSGEALGRAFSDVMANIQACRANHDSALVRAQMMAVAIAGASRYHADFAGFDLNSYAGGRLDHGIGSRPVLPRSTEEELDQAARGWTMVKEAVASGLPMATALREILGWTGEQMAEMAAEQAGEADLTAMMLEDARRRFDQGSTGNALLEEDGDTGTGRRLTLGNTMRE